MTGVGRDVVVGALVAALAGDCLGAPFEGRRAVSRAAGAKRVRRAVSRGRMLRYTDDTQLMLTLAEHLVDHGAVQPAQLSARMLERYEDDRGYGVGMRRLVGLWRAGADVDAAATAVFPDGSFGNGAAMRVAPIGLRWAGRPDELTAAAIASARVSHVHPVGIDGAVLQAHAVARAAITGSFTQADLPDLPASTPELRAGLEAAGSLDPAAAPGTAAQVLGTAPVAHRSVPAALWCAATTGDVAACITLAIALGGDTDTIAAMAAAVRGAATGAMAIPSSWPDVLEGHGEVVAAAERLAAVADPSRPGHA